MHPTSAGRAVQKKFSSPLPLLLLSLHGILQQHHKMSIVVSQAAASTLPLMALGKGAEIGAAQHHVLLPEARPARVTHCS